MINIGDKFGRLTVLEKIDNYYIIKRPKRRKDETPPGYKCICSCGREKIIRGDSLKTTRSCGCLLRKTEASRKYGPAENAVYNRYKKQASQRNIKFEISYDDFIPLLSKNCHYCKCSPSGMCFVNKTKGFRDKILYNGIDRIDSSQSYNINNCVPCCFVCNRMKNDHSLDNFKKQIKKLYQNMENF